LGPISANQEAAAATAISSPPFVVSPNRRALRGMQLETVSCPLPAR
jgi:hypothetical protein